MVLDNEQSRLLLMIHVVMPHLLDALRAGATSLEITGQNSRTSDNAEILPTSPSEKYPEIALRIEHRAPETLSRLKRRGKIRRAGGHCGLSYSPLYRRAGFSHHRPSIPATCGDDQTITLLRRFFL